MKKRFLSICFVIVAILAVCPFTTVSAASVTGSSNESAVYDYLVHTMGYNGAAACGVLACIAAESSFNPNAGSTYYGLCQWGTTRKANLKSYCSSNGYDYTTVDGQMHFLQHELTTSYSSVNNYLKSVSNDSAGAYYAGYYFSYYYLIPGNRQSTSVTRGKTAMNTYCPVYGVATNTDPCALGHTLTTKNAKAATCLSEGYTGDQVCQICGKTISTGETIPISGHTAATVNAVAATCTSDGYTGDTVCSVCGASLSTGETIPATGHNWGDWVVTTEPTCMSEGVETRTCKNDSSHTETRSVDIIDHTTELVGAVSPDWIRDGYTGNLVCTMCGEVIQEGEVIPAVGNGQDISLFISDPTYSGSLTAADLARVFLSLSDSELVLQLQSTTPEDLTEALTSSFTDTSTES